MTNTFTCFPELPLELQSMVWEAAATNLPTLDIQRFTAEITPELTLAHGDADRNNRPRSLLCFKPHADFIRLTTGHRGVLGACRESRKAAQKHTANSQLHINYLTKDAKLNGFSVPKQAFVPFNPAGHFCVSGLGLAIEEASQGQVARGSKPLHYSYTGEYIADQFQGFEELPIENLTIVLDPVLDQIQYMSSWECDVFDQIASRMTNLKKVSLIGDGVLNRRHYIDQDDLDRMHQSVTVPPQSEREGWTIPWHMLWANWKHQMIRFLFMAETKINDMERCQSRNSDCGGSVDSAANAEWKRELKLTMSAVVKDKGLFLSHLE